MIIALGLIVKVHTAETANELESYGKAGGVAEEVFSAIRTVFAFSGQRKEVHRFRENLLLARKIGLKRKLTTAIGIGIFK